MYLSIVWARRNRCSRRGGDASVVADEAAARAGVVVARAQEETFGRVERGRSTALANVRIVSSEDFAERSDVVLAETVDVGDATGAFDVVERRHVHVFVWVRAEKPRSAVRDGAGKVGD